MHSYLFTGSDKQKVYQFIEQFNKKNGGILIEFECRTIEQVRELKQFVSLSVREHQSIFIPSIHEASEAAQNALLKTLEEPQEHVMFLLSTENEEKVLPTIRSRCEIIRVQSSEDTDSVAEFKNYLQMTPGEQLQIISKISKREDAVIFLKGLIAGGRIVMQENTEVYPIVESALMALQRIEGNGNVQLQLSNFVVQHLSQSRA